MTVDVEDYFHVTALKAVFSRDQWDRCESRVARNTERLLEILGDTHVRATFFVLGWVAERFPALVRDIAAQGHEIASHGCNHELIYRLTPAEFRADVRRAKAVLEATSGAAVLGYRAPSYSVTARSLWALDILIEEGHAYDASIFPIYHDCYGIPDAPRHPFLIKRKNGCMIEAPASTLRCWGVNVPLTGGAYFRIFPYAWTRWGIARLNEAENRPAVFYLHPWEIDPHQPRARVRLLSRFRHYGNLAKTEPRLRRLVREFRFAPLSEVLQLHSPSLVPA